MKAEAVLIVSPNWLGDAVMAMPAVRGFRLANPRARIVMLAKPSVAALWRMHAAPDEIVPLDPGTAATFSMARTLRSRRFQSAYMLPNSFRSVLIPFLAGVPRRRGTAFHARGWMITDRVSFASLHEAGLTHQCREYFLTLCGSPEGDTSETGFRPPAPAWRSEWGPRDACWIGVIPGAARGASKRWPYFAEAARRVLQARPDVRFIVAGSADEAPLCAAVARAIGDRAVSVAGQTTLAGFAALLGACRLVMCNDSGGMHLASAAGVPVVAVYGVTDPAATGPIGPNAVVVRAGGGRASRDVPRSSGAAIAALASISPDCVADACLSICPPT